MGGEIFNKKKERVIVYVYGFNLYFCIKQAGLTNCKWLDLKKLALSLFKPHQELVTIKYFTSRVNNNPEKQKRQTSFIEALETTGVLVFYGHYQSDTIECKRCGAVWSSNNEKMTDVNIATQMIIDAYNDDYDTAMLISGDSDLVPPIKAVHQNFSNKRVFVAFPPNRFNKSVKIVAKGSLVIGNTKIRESQLPDEVVKPDGFVLKKPERWKF